MVNPRLKVIGPGNTNTLTVMRNYLRSRFQVLLPEPTAGLYSATLLGFMHDVPKALRTDFSNSGLAHLVAISGQHVGMLAVAIFFVTAMAGMPRNLSMLITAISATIFIALVNFPPSGIRSVIMAGAVYWAYASGRKSQGFRILLLTVALMLMMNPRVLLADLGFQLSALAMWGLIVFYPLGQRYFPRVDLFGLKSIFLMTICAMLATVPIIAYSFSRVSLVGLLANVFAAPLYPLLMFFGLLILFLGWLPFAQWLLLTTTNALAQIFLTMVQFSAQLPGANVQLRELSARYVVLYYFLLFILSLIVSRATRKQFWPLVHITKTNNLIVQSEQKKDEK
jgi:competence protein ComEC